MSVKTKRQIKADYVAARTGLSDALADLMFEHAMERGDALRYLGL